MAEKAMIEKRHLAEQVLGKAEKRALAKEEYWENAMFLFGAGLAHDVPHMGWKNREASLSRYEVFLRMWTVWRLVAAKSMEEKIAQLDTRTLLHSSELEKVEADIEALKGRQVLIKSGEGIDGGQEWAPYMSKDFETIVQRTRELEDAGGASSVVLYCMLELETLLDSVAKKARATGRKYEGRLAASLRDVCRIYEPDEISEEQAKRFGVCVRALIEGWGGLNREKVHLIRSKLLEVGLTWLPVTTKAQKEIEEAKRLTSSADGE